MQAKTKNITIELTCLIFIFLFSYTGFNKLIKHDLFHLTLTQSPWLKNFSDVLSWSVPLIELALVGLLLIPGSKSIGLLSSAILMTLFAFYIAGMLLYVPALPCSCGGIVSQLSWAQHLIFNICLSMLGFVGWRVSNVKKAAITNPTNSYEPA